MNFKSKIALIASLVVFIISAALYIFYDGIDTFIKVRSCKQSSGSQIIERDSACILQVAKSIEGRIRFFTKTKLKNIRISQNKVFAQISIPLSQFVTIPLKIEVGNSGMISECRYLSPDLPPTYQCRLIEPNKITAELNNRPLLLKFDKYKTTSHECSNVNIEFIEMLEKKKYFDLLLFSRFQKCSPIVTELHYL